MNRMTGNSPTRSDQNIQSTSTNARLPLQLVTCRVVELCWPARNTVVMVLRHKSSDLLYLNLVIQLFYILVNYRTASNNFQCAKSSHVGSEGVLVTVAMKVL